MYIRIGYTHIIHAYNIKICVLKQVSDYKVMIILLREGEILCP